MTPTFNVLDYIDGAKKVGISQEQAEYQARQLSLIVDNELVTKSYLSLVLKDLEQRLIIKLGSIMVIGITILGFILKH